MIGILEHIDGRKLTITISGVCNERLPHTVYLRKGVDSAQYLPLLQSEVEVTTVDEKGFKMVERIAPTVKTVVGAETLTKVIKPVLPKTAVEDTKPMDMPSSANVPKLQFGQSSSFTGVVGGGTETVKQAASFPRTQKDLDIMRQWSMGATLNSPALAQCNDALALSTQQTIERAKRVAEELLKWVVER